MLRRLTILSLLVLSLSGLVPAAMACAAMIQQAECCVGEHPPCKTEAPESPSAPPSTPAPCCSTAPPASSTGAAAYIERRDVGEALDDSTAPPPVIAAAHTSSPGMRPVVRRLAHRTDHHLLYLHTGRLRL